jgi:hypothetical protein
MRGKNKKTKQSKENKDSQSTLDLVACLLDVRLLRVWLQSRAGLVTERLPLRERKDGVSQEVGARV